MNSLHSYRGDRYLFRSLYSVASCLSLVIASIALLSSSSSVSGQGTPVGSWDLVLSGRERGVAQITFNGDGTLSGVAAYCFNGSQFFTTNSGGALRTNFYGASLVSGGWIFDRTNRFSGYLNFFAQTGSSGTNYTTNGFSFRGTARNNRVNLKAVGSPGTVDFRGIPLAAPSVDMGDDSYLGTARSRRLPFQMFEIFQLSTESPNFYDVTGAGPGFSYDGTFLVSNQRYAAFFQNRGTGQGGSARVAAYAGPFNPAKRTGTLIGTDGAVTGIKYRIAPQIGN